MVCGYEKQSLLNYKLTQMVYNPHFYAAFQVSVQDTITEHKFRFSTLVMPYLVVEFESLCPSATRVATVVNAWKCAVGDNTSSERLDLR